MMEKTEKKVEYLELIYDLIFVYVIGRNNSLLYKVENGFVSWPVFWAFLVSSLAIIQIWNYSTFYTNIHGRNNIRDHIFMFADMYLLYYIGEGTRIHWEGFYVQYHTAWALILITTGIQYALERRNHTEDPDMQSTIRGMMIALFGEALLVLLAIPVYKITGRELSAGAILYGILIVQFLTHNTRTAKVDFMHLTERAMLYVVFTFGEMIIHVAPYFESPITPNSVYFSTMSFLIVLGLFLSYEIFYDHILDRGQKRMGVHFMMIHIFLIFGMNMITTSLDFMRNEMIDLRLKMIFLLAAFLLYFFCMHILLRYAKPEMLQYGGFLKEAAVLTTVFVIVMFVLRENMYLNILISVLYVFAQFIILLIFFRQHRKHTGDVS